MSIRHDDPLYQIFEQHLHSGLYDEAPVENFVRDVVDFYWKDLQKIGHIPGHLQETVIEDLAQDVTEMLKVKTYGYFGIGEYNSTRLKKSS